MNSVRSSIFVGSCQQSLSSREGTLNVPLKLVTDDTELGATFIKGGTSHPAQRFLVFRLITMPPRKRPSEEL
jgi:hypothetical protein